MKTLYQVPQATRYAMQAEALMATSKLKVNDDATLVGSPESRRYDAWDFTEPTYNLFED
ncbi:MAG: hypothetical protein Q4A44_05880 [Bacteroidales bacterium]|nr:hypothetical protein [Bacteroidales bacterium]